MDGYCYLVCKSHLTLCDPMDCSLPGSSVQRMDLQIIILGKVSQKEKGKYHMTSLIYGI